MKSFSEFKKARKNGLTYQVESAKQDFMISVNTFMKSGTISKAQLASSIGCSQSYITKVMKGEANFTIETMVKISNALNAKLCIHLAHRNDDIQWMGMVKRSPSPKVKAQAWAHDASDEAKIVRAVGHA